MSKKFAKKSKPTSAKLTVDQTLRFLEDARTLYHGPDEPTQAISLRVPKNVLRAFKTKAGLEDRKYQSVIVALMRKWIVEK
jgi:hypothetical protein